MDGDDKDGKMGRRERGGGRRDERGQAELKSRDVKEGRKKEEEEGAEGGFYRQGYLAESIPPQQLRHARQS